MRRCGQDFDCNSVTGDEQERSAEPHTIEAVNKAMEGLDNCPNDFVRAHNRKKKSNIIAVYSLSFDHTFFSSLLEAIEEESNLGYHLLILSLT